MTKLGHFYTIAITGTIGTLAPDSMRKVRQSYSGMYMSHSGMYMRGKSGFFSPIGLLPKRDHNDLALGQCYLVERELPQHQARRGGSNPIFIALTKQSHRSIGRSACRRRMSGRAVALMTGLMASDQGLCDLEREPASTQMQASDDRLLDPSDHRTGGRRGPVPLPRRAEA
jgi:hypothetical protein